MKKVMLVGLSLLFLSGCLGTQGPRVVIVDNNLQPAQIVDKTPIDVRYIDPASNQEVIKKEDREGNYVLTPSTYKKLLTSAMDNTNPSK